MGWDIVSIGTYHKLPLDNPIEAAKRLASLCNGPISIGYFKNWSYDAENNLIIPCEYDWIEIAKLNADAKGDLVRFEIMDKYVKDLYEKVYKHNNFLRFRNKDERESFLSYAEDSPFSIFELENTIHYLPNVRTFKEFADFSDNFSGRWFGFHNMFYEPYDGEIKQRLDDFRKYIFQQMTVCGCEKAYYFPDQGYGEILYNLINLPVSDWEAYLCSGLEISDENSNDEPLNCFHIFDYLSHKRILEEGEYAHCFIDDFSDFKKNI